MMLKRCCCFAILIMLASVLISAHVSKAESKMTFREENGLQIYNPPEWFLKGYFIAREKNPSVLFGPVQDFVGSLGGKGTWLIEDFELERIQRASADGKKTEYSFFFEVVGKDKTTYWGFVALPYESAQAWYDARRAYHGRKAQQHYGETRDELERALSQGFNVTAELRFWIENGKANLQSPEDVIMDKFGCKPVFDLSAGHRPVSSSKTD